MLRDKFAHDLKNAMKARNALGVSTVRLIIARLKEQDIDARGRGKAELDDAQNPADAARHDQAAARIDRAL